MEGNLQCARHEEQIKTLFKQDEAIIKRVDSMDWMRDSLTKLTTLMEITIEDSKRRDDENKKRDEENKAINQKQNETLSNMNQSLIEINNNMSSMNSRIGTLEEKVDENEKKNSIDLRDTYKEKNISLLKKYGEPAVIIGAIGTILLKLIEIFKG